ncbi:MAG: hypothetical protein SPK00_06020 [Corynebacterium glucuronolyticum]|nr:hypothetical protein [Mycobacteriaceae bacterium]MDY5834292.1 hypothetical protein [Corynebacterium glucuronolyticum]
MSYGSLARRMAAAITAIGLSITGATAATAQSSSSSTDNLGRPNQDILNAATNWAETLPAPLKDQILAAVGFFGDNGEGKIPLNGPVISQFLWPTVSRGCIAGNGDSVGSAVAVPGPADLPLPGVEPGNTAFVFTALGTDGARDTDMTVQWINLTTLHTETTRLEVSPDLNPDGPATVTGTAATGGGPVLALIHGHVNGCYFPPTVASFSVA